MEHLARPNSDLVLKVLGGVSLLQEVIASLKQDELLHNAIIDAYGTLIQREAAEKDRSVHVLGSFFWPNLEKGQLNALSHLTDGRKVFDRFRFVFVPMHVRQNHYVCAHIDTDQRRIELYDSLGGRYQDLDKLARWLDGRQLDKQTNPDWEIVHVQTSPHQENGVDCGIFVIKTMLTLSRSEGQDYRQVAWDFSQEDMPAIRKRIVYELMEAGRLFKADV